MFKLIAFIFLFISQAHAANWVNVESYRSGSLSAYGEEKYCPQPCVNLGDNGQLDIFKISETIADDLSKPIYEDTKAGDCTSDENCREIAKTMCVGAEDLIITSVADVFTLYCRKRVGFEKKTIYAVEVDPVKVAAIDSKNTAERTLAAQKKLAMERLAAVDFSKVTTIAQLKTIFQDLLIKDGVK